MIGGGGGRSLARSAVSSNYTANPPSQQAPLQIGPWRVERATHNSNGKVVSIWTADKSALAPPGAKAGSGVAKRVESSSITFATEPVTASLRQAIAASSSSDSYSRRKEENELELDEVEIQKGLSQVGKGLQFLHDSAKLVHGNLTPESVVINAKGDWKLSGFGLSTYLFGPDGVPAKWEYPEYDHNMSSHVQKNFDYIAPEYALDETAPAPSNDLYSLGCILHSIHTKSGPPFSNRNSLENARTNIEEGLSRGLIRPTWRKLSDDAQGVLSQLVTRYPSARLSASSFLQHPYFSNLLVSTLRFLERDSFAAQTSEAQASFLKGLVGVLPRFSDKVNRRKVLPSLLEETRKAGLIPFLLPNILYIAGKMDTDSFRAEVLPHLKPLFGIKDPPQAVISLLDNLSIFSEKCTPTVFREEVMPLIYAALESDNPVVLEKALKVVPRLSETLDYTTVKQTLFPKITVVFTKTTLLSVKVNTLICFHSMIPILDKFTLTEKLVPLLAKIKTKEPAVMIATLAVHEEMGKKCEIEAIATLILPQLWAMSMGPLLNADQFAKFLAVIKKLGARVEEEHSRHLAELKRLEDSSNSGRGGAEPLDFESLVRGGGGAQTGAKEVSSDMWDDLSSGTRTPSIAPSPAMSPAITPSTFSSHRPTASTSNSSLGASKLGARPVPSSSFNATSFSPPPSAPATPSYPAIQPSFPSSPAPPQNGSSSLGSFAPLQPSRPAFGSTSSTTSMNSLASSTSSRPAAASSSSYAAGRPNYDISLPSATPTSTYTPSYQQPLQPQTLTAPKPQWNIVPPQQQQQQQQGPQAPPKPQWNVAPPPGFGGGVLQPTVVKKAAPGGFGDWADLDPLK
ncbi:protein serine/threonine kinase [Pseudohyphozyma bogoriensis]|nr:protein serine/threonine kinase [Pseudohyphozyma bogoriensis]